MSELQEETGWVVDELRPMGSYLADAGRLSNRVHVFYGKPSHRDPQWAPEAGVRAFELSAEEMNAAIAEGKYCNALHVMAWNLCQSFFN